MLTSLWLLGTFPGGGGGVQVSETLARGSITRTRPLGNRWRKTAASGSRNGAKGRGQQLSSQTCRRWGSQQHAQEWHAGLFRHLREKPKKRCLQPTRKPRAEVLHCHRNHRHALFELRCNSGATGLAIPKPLRRILLRAVISSSQWAEAAIDCRIPVVQARCVDDSQSQPLPCTSIFGRKSPWVKASIA